MLISTQKKNNIILNLGFSQHFGIFSFGSFENIRSDDDEFYFQN